MKSAWDNYRFYETPPQIHLLKFRSWTTALVVVIVVAIILAGAGLKYAELNSQYWLWLGIGFASIVTIVAIGLALSIDDAKMTKQHLDLLTLTRLLSDHLNALVTEGEGVQKNAVSRLISAYMHNPDLTGAYILSLEVKTTKMIGGYCRMLIQQERASTIACLTKGFAGDAARDADEVMGDVLSARGQRIIALNAIAERCPQR